MKNNLTTENLIKAKVYSIRKQKVILKNIFHIDGCDYIDYILNLESIDPEFKTMFAFHVDNITQEALPFISEGTQYELDIIAVAYYDQYDDVVYVKYTPTDIYIDDAQPSSEYLM